MDIVEILKDIAIFLMGAAIVFIFAGFILVRNVKKTTEISTDLRVVTARCDTLQQLLEEKKEELEQVKQVERDLQSALLKEKEKNALQDKDRELEILGNIEPVKNQLKLLQELILNMQKDRTKDTENILENLKKQEDVKAQFLKSAHSLTQALRSSKERGGWGEVQLINVIEASGMREHIDYVYKQHIQTEESRVYPDLIVHLPQGVKIVVDAKAPMESYLKAADMTQEDRCTDREYSNLITAHARAVRAHIDILAKKNYPSELSGSIKFTIAYIPSESALSAAIKADSTLLDYAFSKGIALSSAVGLWSILKSTASLWHQEHVSKSAQGIIALAEDLNKRLTACLAHLSHLGTNLKSSVSAYDKFVGSLESRVMPSIRRLTTKENAPSIPDVIDRIPRSVRGMIMPDAEKQDTEKQDTEKQDTEKQDAEKLKVKGSEEKNPHAEQLEVEELGLGLELEPAKVERGHKSDNHQ